jgi:nucleotide-binding universal stress UspA family protein
MKKILLATELGKNSERALDFARMFTSQFNAELHVLHVLEDLPSNTPMFGGGLALSTYVHESPSVVEEKIHSLFDPAWLIGKQIVVATAEGAPGAQILRYANEHNIDLVILGTHGRTGLTYILVGSVAEQVTRQSKCPVLVVRSLE